MESIANRLTAVYERIAAAAREAGRDPDEVRLVGVTKTHPPEVIAEAFAAGLRDFGENRVQEAEVKVAALGADRARMVWHLIGQLQRNKSKKAALLFDMIHSIDGLRLAEVLDRHVAEVCSSGGVIGQGALRGDGPLVQRLPVLLEVNVSGEVSKGGFALSGWEGSAGMLEAFLGEVEVLLALPHVEVRGLMTIAPWSADPAVARSTFRSVRRLRDVLVRRLPAGGWVELSMGMSDDFAIAVAEGATIVRVGRAIFGARG